MLKSWMKTYYFYLVIEAPDHVYVPLLLSNSIDIGIGHTKTQCSSNTHTKPRSEHY